ncbi:hypothetical protein GGI35DRAFT_486183 [Trichoderma velutinum]
MSDLQNMPLQELPVEMEIDEEVSVYEYHSLQQTDSTTNQFIHNALLLFKMHCQEIHHFYNLIITSAFTIVNNAILHSGDCVWRSRLAYVQLTQILISLKSIITRRGRLRRGTEPLSPKVLRQQVQNRVRTAKRWADLISGSIFIATAYNDKAEMMIRDFSVTNARIKEVANHALQACTLFLPKKSMLSNDYIFEQDMAAIRPI